VAQLSGAAQPVPQRRERGHNYDAVAKLVGERVERSKGRISAKRLLPDARVAGYEGRRGLPAAGVETEGRVT